MSLRAMEGPGAVQIAQQYSSYPSQDSEKHSSSPFSPVEKRLKLCVKSHEEGENGGQSCPGAPPKCEILTQLSDCGCCVQTRLKTCS